MTIETAIILAGGLGTRLRSTVPNLPKPMAPVNNRPFLEYLMTYWMSQGVSNFILSVGYKYEIIIDHFGFSWKGVPIQYEVEKTPLGTGGGLLRAANGIEAPFLVLNGDTFFEVDLKKMEQFHYENNADWTFALFKTIEDGRYMGLDLSSKGRVNSIRISNNYQERLANGGVYLIDPNLLEKYQKNSSSKVSIEDDIFPYLNKLGARIFGFKQSGSFIDIGIPEDYRLASKIVKI